MSACTMHLTFPESEHSVALAAGHRIRRNTECTPGTHPSNVTKNNTFQL